MILCEQINFIDYMEGRDPFGRIKNHLLDCAKCRKKFDENKKLLNILTIVKKKEFLDEAKIENDIQDKPLPESIKKLVKQRKKSWLEEKATKTADDLGYEDGDKKDNIIKLITQRETQRAEDVFLNAAFSDDLLKGKRKAKKDKAKKDKKEKDKKE